MVLWYYGISLLALFYWYMLHVLQHNDIHSLHLSILLHNSNLVSFSLQLNHDGEKLLWRVPTKDEEADFKQAMQKDRGRRHTDKSDLKHNESKASDNTSASDIDIVPENSEDKFFFLKNIQEIKLGEWVR